MNAAEQSISTDLKVNLKSVIALSLTNCSGAPDASSASLTLKIIPEPGGKFASNCQNLTVSTNAPGYSLTARAENSEGDNSLLYLNPTEVTPLPEIPSTIDPISAPDVLSPDSWGFAAISGNIDPSLQVGTALENFTSTYAANNATNIFAELPADDTTIYATTELPEQIDELTFYYGANATSHLMAGIYSLEVTYTAVAAYIPATYCWTDDYECIIFTIDTSDGTYSIPTSSYLNGAVFGHDYDWDVYVDGVLTTDCPNGNCAGTGHFSTTPGVNGIELTGLTSGTHQIRIMPHGEPAPGWGNAFGYYTNTTGANAQANKNKLISLDAPLTTMAFAPKPSESIYTAFNMLSYTFYNCTNLTNAARIVDTYKLPGTIYSLQSFLSYIHYGNSKITKPIDLSMLSSWLSSDNSITSLNDFLSNAHNNNVALISAVDLSPLSGWFSDNTTISTMRRFLWCLHQANNNVQFIAPINLEPLSGWFSSNNSISNLSEFLSDVHYGNSWLAAPINLAPISGWFSGNTSILDLSFFLSSVHVNNSQLNTPINLAPLSGWFVNNNNINNLSFFLNWTHAGNSGLSSPVNLTPLSGWFNANTSINNLSYFLDSTHGNNSQLTTPINLVPLSNWFASGRSFTSLTRFLCAVHQNNTSLTINGQTILPNWIKTMQEGSTEIWNVANSFYRMFHTLSIKTGDTGEIKFVDGDVLSNLGEPSAVNNNTSMPYGVNKETYLNRTDITPVNVNWQ